MLFKVAFAKNRRQSSYAVALCRVLLLVLLLAACQPIQPAPAPEVEPTVDRVGFPENYQSAYSVYYEFDRPDNRTARVIYANPAAAEVGPGQNFPYGSVLVMEVYRTKRDYAGAVVLNDQGRFQRDELTGIFVMRKERGFGSKYKDLRNGEWEYVAYKADKSVLTPPERTNGCAACHMEAGQGKDWVFGAHRHTGEIAAATTATNTVTLNDYGFSPQVMTVTVGSEVTWSNNDVVFHTATGHNAAFSAMLRPHGGFRHKFEEAGEFDYFCAAHPSMKGKIVVVAQ